MRFAGNRIFLALASVAIAANARGAVELGIDVLESNGYALLKNKRVGLITNQTGVNSRGVRTRVLLRKNCNLVALYTPEHGLGVREKAARGIGPAGIVASWTPEVVWFKAERSQYLIY
jgi:uncharacterized protein YbbC (DUF1343 family)